MTHRSEGGHGHVVVTVWLVGADGLAERLTLGQVCLDPETTPADGTAITSALRQVADRIDVRREFQQITRHLEGP